MKGHAVQHNLLLLILALVALLPKVGLGAAPPAQQSPLQVQVGTYLMSIGKLDISSNSYHMDFYLIFRCDRPCDPGNFEVINGRGYTVERQENEPTYKVYRVRGEMNTTLNLRPFPFDRHSLAFSIEDKFMGHEALRYVPDRAHSGLHGDLVLPGWRIANNDYFSSVRTDTYKVFGQSYSHYTFGITLERPILSAFLKGLLPGLLIVVTGLLALLMGPDKIMQRLTVATSALVASVLFHINLTSLIPPVGYLTFADRFMILNYLTLLGAIAASIWLMNLVDAKRDDEAAPLHKKIRVLAPLSWLLVQIGNALWGIS